MEPRRYRVAQWGTGNVGLYALRAIIEHPHFDLVGCCVYSDAKAGKDAGELCGLPANGIRTTQDIADIVAAKPDCVVYMPHEADFNDVCRLLEAGINISTSRMEFNYRDRLEPGLRARIEAACGRGHSSIYGTGSTPGWFTEVMPLALSALERRLDCITLTDYADMSSRNSPEMLFQVLPFGADPTTIDNSAPVGTAMSSPPSLSMTAAALGLAVDEIVTGRDFALTKGRVEIPAGVLEPGTIGAMRMTIAGLRDGKVVIRRNSIWYLTRDVEPAWDLRDTGLHYRVEGDLPLDVMITIPVSAEDYPKVSPALTANPVVNAVPLVCAAAPGVRHTDELSPLLGKFG
jgi:4-hydroxy-tetrahydrodipicolinate reductase